MTDIDALFVNLNSSELTFHRLTNQDEKRIQLFLESCNEFSIMENGKPAKPGAGLKFLQDIPPGFTLDKKFAYSIEKEGQIIGLFDLIQDYPVKDIWWIGLFLLLPESRGKGFGSQVIRIICDSLIHLKAKEVRLGVLEENKVGYEFWQKMKFSLIDKKTGRKFGEKIHTVLVMQHLLNQKLLRIASQ
jgi:GNAT superfamily N-acetyltransferase